LFFTLFITKFLLFQIIFLPSFRVLVLLNNITVLEESQTITISESLYLVFSLYNLHLALVLVVLSVLQPVVTLGGFYVCGWPFDSEFDNGVTLSNFSKYSVRLFLSYVFLSMVIFNVLPCFPDQPFDLHTQYRYLMYPIIQFFPIFDSLIYCLLITTLSSAFELIFLGLRTVISHWKKSS